jgi:hypothetical protein
VRHHRAAEVHDAAAGRRRGHLRATLASVAVEKSSKRRTKRVDLAKPVEHPRIPYGVLFRMFVLGSVAIGASTYAIYRHYYVTRPSMLMPRPTATATATADDVESLPPGFVAVPDLVPLPAASASAPSASASAASSPAPPLPAH